MSKGTRTIEVQKDKVTIEHEHHAEPGGVNVIALTAHCGETVVTHSHTIGAVDGAIPDHYDQTQFERELDEQREKLARRAQSHERIRRMAAAHE